MEITKEVLNNLKLKRGKLSEKRCQEINQMKIKNPYANLPYYTEGEFFKIDNGQYFYASMDERIVFILAFEPMPILRREIEKVYDSTEKLYDDIYLLFIDDEWIEVIFDGAKYKQLSNNNIHYYYCEKDLRINQVLDSRKDYKEIIYLLEEMSMAKHRFNKCEYEEYELNINYKGESYPWRNWKEL